MSTETQNFSAIKAACARSNGAIVITIVEDKMLFVSAKGRDGGREGFGLPQAIAAEGEDIASCACRILREQLHISVLPGAVRYIGSITTDVDGHTHWQPVVLARISLKAIPGAPGMVACTQSSVDAMIASGGLTQATSLAALLLYRAKNQVGHLT